MAGGEDRRRKVDVHAAAGTRNKPNFPSTHNISLCSLFKITSAIGRR
jgi:hypothetical protein